MINIVKDLFVHLSISANKLKNSSNKQKEFETNKSKDEEKRETYSIQPKKDLLQEKKNLINALLKEEVFSNTNKDNNYNIEEKDTQIKSVEEKKYDDYKTVDYLRYKKEIESLENELARLENIFKELQKKETNVDLLLKVDNQIRRIKKIIEEKSKEIESEL